MPRKRTHVDLLRSEARRVELGGGSGYGLCDGRGVTARAVQLVTQLAREATAVHHDRDFAHLGVNDLEALERIHRLAEQLVHHLR